jgi:hypothetical protein
MLVCNYDLLTLNAQSTISLPSNSSRSVSKPVAIYLYFFTTTSINSVVSLCLRGNQFVSTSAIFIASLIIANPSSICSFVTHKGGATKI